MEDVITDNEEVANDESDAEESDNEEVQFENSDSEQGISDTEEGDVSASNSLSFVGKNGVTYWKKHSHVPKTVRTRAENIVKKFPSPKLSTRSLKEAKEIWEYFINKDMINLIVEFTNQYIQSIVHKFERPRDATTTDALEIRALLGLLYLAGLYHANRMNVEEFWKTDGSGIEIFRLTMSLQRFRFLLRCLRFDDKNSREERRATDKLAAIRTFFDSFVNNCQNGYNHSEYVTVDEMLPGFRGRCSFRQYIPSKPNKYGIKIYALADAYMYYTSRMEVYVGKQPAGPFNLSTSTKDLVLRLTDNIRTTGRNLTIDNWFTSIPLVEELMTKPNKMTVIGTIKKNKAELPLEFTKPEVRPECTSMFGFRPTCTLVSYIPKKKKNVLLVSSLHKSDEIDDKTGEKRKPSIVTEYNQTKCGVDVVDKLCASYNCSRNTRRWPMVIFYTLLNIAGINSQVIHTTTQIKNF
ncbi:hypothetical protein NQ314_003334 [Rhamnusium bicolor]|uniref:PiggyBac transposable element-derived protein domain-containing protein n=1 Tax=Rhamnusium bicolor TaxID=1586634 RepID=A0AAV8ZMA3_9CUCU|nr:hypothetical protein NQ314_003334 [Rhamnusium bicolor]